MISTSARLVTAAVLSAALASAAVPVPGLVTLAVDGRANATPWIDADGQFVAVAWGASNEGRADVYAAISRDGGNTFDVPVRVNRAAGEARLGGEFPPRIAVTAPPGPTPPQVSVLWNARGDVTALRLARSTDGGRSFQAPATLSAADAAGDRGWPALALDGQGRAHAIWLDHRGLAGRGGRGHSHGQGAPADNAVAMAQQSSLYYVRSGPPAGAEQELSKGVCYCCKTALAAGADGALFAAWRHVFPGGVRDIAFAASRDGGRSFTPPVRVSADGWAINACPDDGPAIAVDAGGTVHVVWPTVLPGRTPEGALFYASSRDGRTFTPRVRIPTAGSPKPSHAQIAIGPAGRIVVAWDELAGGRRQAFARELKRGASGALDWGAAIGLSDEGPASYPVLAATDRGILAVWATGGSASVVKVRQVELP